MGIRKDNIVVPDEIYILTGKDYCGNFLSTATDDLNGVRHKQKIRYLKEITEELTINEPKYYWFRGLVSGNPIQLAELSHNNKFYRVKSEPIINAIIKYGSDIGGKMLVPLVWKKVNGYFGLYEL